MDLDGSTLPTEIVSVNFKIENAEAMIFPNPVQDIVNIVLESEVLGGIDIEVFNQNGQRIFKGKIDTYGTQVNIPATELNIKNRGSYTILYHNKIRTETLRFVKVD